MTTTVSTAATRLGGFPDRLLFLDIFGVTVRGPFTYIKIFCVPQFQAQQCLHNTQLYHNTNITSHHNHQCSPADWLHEDRDRSHLDVRRPKSSSLLAPPHYGPHVSSNTYIWHLLANATSLHLKVPRSKSSLRTKRHIW